MISFFRKSSDNYFVIEHNNKLSKKDKEKLSWLFSGSKYLKIDSIRGSYVGPIKEMTTPWSTNAVEITKNIGITSITRIECLYKTKSDHDQMTQSLYENPDQNIFTITKVSEPVIYIDNIKRYNNEEGLALSKDEILYLESVSKRLKRKLTDSEVFGFSQVNSEHCRHKIFNGKFIIDDTEKDSTLFGMIKATSKANPNNIISAYKDNVAFISGPEIEIFTTKKKNDPDFYIKRKIKSSISLKAETHNFPTTVEPFSGAATGSGGEIRDRMAGGQASIPLAGTTVYMTSYPRTSSSKTWEKNQIYKKWLYQNPKDILIKASNGASDYGNKFGQPLICGSVLTFEHTEKGKQLGYDKVIMLAGGIGFGKEEETKKKDIREGDYVVVLGGDNYRIGMGGGAVSSVNTGEFKNNIELNAVQRSNPEMQKRVANVIRSLAEEIENPILSIHDHGAGGHLNCLSELLEETGGEVDINKLPVGDSTLSEKEIIGNESQERMGLVIKQKDYDKIKRIAERERAPIYHVGYVKENKKLVFKGKEKVNPIDLNLNDFFGSSPKTIISDKKLNYKYKEPKYFDDLLIKYLENVVSLESVSCKDWLTNKVDRCVTGRVALQQTLGKIQLPLNNLGVMAFDFLSNKGIATSLGFSPVTSIIDEKIGSKYSILKSITNIIWAPLNGGLSNISLSANWMWPANNLGENSRLYNAVESVSKFAIGLGVNIPTGKDSLSMTQKYPDGMKVISPGTVIISAVSEVEDINNIIKPQIVQYNDSKLIYINLCDGYNLGGSAFYQTLSCLGNNVCDTKSTNEIKNIFKSVQTLIKNKEVLAGHDISSGGLITSLMEMNFPNDRLGINICLDDFNENDINKILFNESPGIILQIKKSGIDYLTNLNINFIDLGNIVDERKVIIRLKEKKINLDINHFRDSWYRNSFLLDKEQTSNNKSLERFNNYKKQPLIFKFPDFNGELTTLGFSKEIKAAVIREKGINSEREMAYMLDIAGFKVKDVHMTDLVSGKETLEDISMVVFPGGFSNSDVLGSAKGWAGAFKYNKKAKTAIEAFYKRKDTLSLGVCNGCQLMMELNLIYPSLKEEHPKMNHNDSKKFECSFLSVDIIESNSVMLKNLVGSTLGIWSAHGEGKFNLNNKKINIAAKFHYDEYPGNPNGSDLSTAAICSEDGRHLAIMPHLERSIFPWNWAHYPKERNDKISPWIIPFYNARKWLEENA
ncbi:MAG: phosphoribosylformylglycinamidine synthase [Rhodothermaeota bacterium MED-G19]|nr:MAG: phosphoribosylformylglycinamidine synthase [Rhodothermaeota bacterium MED-G19]